MKIGMDAIQKEHQFSSIILRVWAGLSTASELPYIKNSLCHSKTFNLYKRNKKDTKTLAITIENQQIKR